MPVSLVKMPYPSVCLDIILETGKCPVCLVEAERTAFPIHTETCGYVAHVGRQMIALIAKIDRDFLKV